MMKSLSIYPRKEHNVKKKELISAIAEEASLSVSQMEKAFNATFQMIEKLMREEGGVAISGFGSFLTKARAERNGRNPSTGETIRIPQAIVPAFKASSQLKESINTINKE